jgi:hypothetical protein
MCETPMISATGRASSSPEPSAPLAFSTNTIPSPAFIYSNPTPATSSLNIEESQQQRASPGPRQIRLASLNTDGIRGDNSLEIRAVEACRQLRKENPDIILLQEVVDLSLPIFRQQLAPHFKLISKPGKSSYYCCIFVSNHFSVVEDSYSAQNFAPSPRLGVGSDMGRMLYRVSVTGGRLGDSVIDIFTSHLESTGGKVAGGKRILQLYEACSEMVRTPFPAIFGGDTNLRVSEVSGPAAWKAAFMAANGTPEDEAAGAVHFKSLFRPAKKSAIVDAFCASGEPEEHKITWDVTENNPYGMQPHPINGCRGWQMRFDRYYYKRNGITVVPGSFRVVCKEPFHLTGPSSGKLFASDHYGMCCDWEVASSS